MKKKALISLFLAGALLLSGCAAQNTAQTAASAAASASAGTAATAAASTTAANTASGSTTATTAAGSAVSDTTAAVEVTTVSANTEVFSDRDFEVGYSEDAVRITLAGSGASCANSTVVIDGGTVTITAGGTYILSGTLDDGMVIVDADKTEKVQLVLDGVTIHSETSAALYVRQADKVFVTMTQGSVNTLSNGGSFEAIDENNIDAVIFSKDDLTLNGSGTLTVESPAGHGIVSKDELTVTSGTYEISAASHGMTAKDGIGLANAAFTIVSGKDGIHAENSDDEAAAYVYIQSGSYHITAEGDGISASGDLTVIDGSFELLCGGGSANGTKSSSDAWGQFQGGFGGGMGGRGSMGGKGGKSSQGSIGYYGQSDVTAATSDNSDDSTSIKGLKAGGLLTVNGGDFSIDAADDAVHSNGDLIVNGGSFQIATGDDGFHADNDLTVNDGTIVITESREGIEGTHVTISGGDITLTAEDDGINAMGGKDSSGFSGRDAFGGWGGSSSSGSILIEGGNLYIQSSGDGLDANGTLTITGGYTVVCGPTQGDTATLDYDVSGTITGGTFLGTGASGMAQSFSAAEQGVIAVNVGNQSAGSTVTLKDASGNTVCSFTPALSFAVVILSDSSLASGQTYTLTAGSYSGTVTAK